MAGRNLRFLIALTQLVRTGWMQRGVPPAIGETVADHSFISALIALEVGLRARERGCKVDPYKASAIALSHDLPEHLVGDLPKWTSDKIGRMKESLELDAIDEMRWKVSDLAREYIEGASQEAKLAKFSELLATYVVARYYISIGIRWVEEIAESTLRGAKKVLDELEPILREEAKKLMDEVIE